MTTPIKDSQARHWVNRTPASVRPYLQLSRLDRPIGYWLLALPGWIGLAFATLSHGFTWTDLKWAALILVGAIAMRGAGCTYNDIVDQDLDAKVERTALRPLPAGTVTTKQAWIWLFAQCGIGLIVLLCLPRLAQLIAMASIPLVAIYPFMKRITYWPQAWLGLTFNWAVLVAYAAKTGTVSPALFILYAGLVFWTIGYDTIYACQDIEDDALIGVKSTARRFGKRVKTGVGLSYLIACILIASAFELNGTYKPYDCGDFVGGQWQWGSTPQIDDISIIRLLLVSGFFLHLLIWQTLRLEPKNSSQVLQIFKSNLVAAIILILPVLLLTQQLSRGMGHDGPCWVGVDQTETDDYFKPINRSPHRD